jgi:hypothetical protein
LGTKDRREAQRDVKRGGNRRVKDKGKRKKDNKGERKRRCRRETNGRTLGLVWHVLHKTNKH